VTSELRDIPAVVVGGTLNALGVVRSLAHGAMPIHVLETTRQCAAGWSGHSRYVRTASIEGRGLVEALLRLSASLGCRPVLLLTSDQSVNSVSEFRDEIEPHYRISMPRADIVSALSDKVLFQTLAERAGFAVPRSVGVVGGEGLGRLGELTPPLIIKPADKTLVLRGDAERAVKADSTVEAQRLVRRMLESAPAVIVQEWIDGPDAEIFFSLFSCNRDGQILGLFPGRKLVCNPPAVGSTAVCIAAPEVAVELAAQTRNFVRTVGYRGLGSLEFKRDSRTGRFLIIEPTVGRTDWQEEIATLCGVNLPLLTYLAECDADIPASEFPYPSVAWCSSIRFRFPRPSGTRVVDGFFRWSDPIPALYYYVYERAVLRAWRLMRRPWARSSAAGTTG
jgi:D-aspartate ligase